MKKIRKWGVSNLRNEECFGYLQFAQASTSLLPKESTDSGDDGGPSIQSSGTSRAAEEGSSPALTEAMEIFSNAVDEFDEALELSRKNPASEKATQADEARDKGWRGLNGYVKIMTDHPDGEIAAVAEEAKAILDLYGDPTSLAMTEESGVIHNILQDFEALGSTKRAKISVDAWLERVKQAQEDYNSAAEERADYSAQRQKGVAKEKRLAAESAYRDLVQLVNAMAFVNGDAPYEAFIDRMNSEADRQSAISKARATRNAKKREEEGGSGDDDRPVVQ